MGIAVTFVGGPRNGEVAVMADLPQLFFVPCFDGAHARQREMLYRFKEAAYCLLPLRGERQDHYVYVFDGLTSDEALGLLLANYRPLPPRAVPERDLERDSIWVDLKKFTTAMYVTNRPRSAPDAEEPQPVIVQGEG